MPTFNEIIKQTETAISKIEERPFDRFLLGPFMIWYGLRSKSMPKWPRRLMVAGGMFQLLYAWTEYRRALGAITKSPKDFFEVIQTPE